MKSFQQDAVQPSFRDFFVVGMQLKAHAVINDLGYDFESEVLAIELAFRTHDPSAGAQH